MNFRNANADIFVPDALGVRPGLARVTHLGIGAHQDDLEFMAFHGILAAYQKEDRWFGGVICSDGAGSARTGRYAAFTDREMAAIRVQEQKRAASIGGYGAVLQLGYTSREIRDPANSDLIEDLQCILEATRPDIVYTHNPADKHDTHVGVLVATLEALRRLPVEARPRTVYGCEVWRDLDWMLDADKVALDVSGNDDLAIALHGVFDSQIAGGKRYDLAVRGRQRANATFLSPHQADESSALTFAMDLSALVADDTRDVVAFVGDYLDRFREDVVGKLARRMGH